MRVHDAELYRDGLALLALDPEALVLVETVWAPNRHVPRCLLPTEPLWRVRHLPALGCPQCLPIWIDRRGRKREEGGVQDLRRISIAHKAELLCAVRANPEDRLVERAVTLARRHFHWLEGGPRADDVVPVPVPLACNLRRDVLEHRRPGYPLPVALPHEEDLVNSPGGYVALAGIDGPVLVLALIVRTMDPHCLAPLILGGVDDVVPAALHDDLEALAPGLSQHRGKGVAAGRLLAHLLEAREAIPRAPDVERPVGVAHALQLGAAAELPLREVLVAVGAEAVVRELVADERAAVPAGQRARRAVLERQGGGLGQLHEGLRHRCAAREEHLALATRAGEGHEVHPVVPQVIERPPGVLGPPLAAANDLAPSVRAADAEGGDAAVAAVLPPGRELAGEVHRVSLDDEVRIQDLQVQVRRSGRTEDHHDTLRKARHSR
mmetsp:Transcript_109115/g.352256  ORF Transcript_109115/g.352256 Transcript_109115/m.352256 type:complete len:437 (-) Transcript_109115:1481-2791(-)